MTHTTFSAVSPSAIYRKATKRPQVSTMTAPMACSCNACGFAIAEGAPCEEASYLNSFSNQLDLRAKGSGFMCADCAAIMSSTDFLTRFSKTVANEHGIFKLAATEDGAAFMANPPETPFVAIFSTRNAQHMVWRTPVTYSKDFIFLRLDDEVLTIRRKLVLEAFEDWKVLTELLWTHPDKAMQKAKILLTAPALDNRSIGAVLTRVERWAVECGQGARVDRLNSLSAGEWWGLHRLIHVKPASRLEAMVPVVLGLDKVQVEESEAVE